MIADGEGSVITGRFVTRQVDVIARAEILGADGSIEVLEGTTIHPIWSLGRNDWVPLCEFEQANNSPVSPAQRQFSALESLTNPLPSTILKYTESTCMKSVNIDSSYTMHVPRHQATMLPHQSGDLCTRRTSRAWRITFKEYYLKATGGKIDFLDLAKGIVYELKPNNPRAIARGIKQAEGYVAELQKIFPGVNWKIIVETY